LIWKDGKEHHGAGQGKRGADLFSALGVGAGTIMRLRRLPNGV
jgi:hypothetical protein